MELNSGLEEREEEAHLLTGQVRGNISEDSENQVLNIFPEFKCSNCLKLKVEKAAEELEEAERQEVEAQREAVALQEQIEKMIQVEVKVMLGQVV